MSEDRHQGEFVHKVSKLSTALINYKKTKDASKRYYDEIVILKEQVLNDGLNLGQSPEMVIQMVYDMTKNQLTEWYIRRLFSEDFNRRMLPTKCENTHNDSYKDTEKSSCTVTFPTKSSDSRTSPLSTELSTDFQCAEEVETIELDLKQALETGLKDHIEKCENSNRASYIVRLFVEDTLLRKIERG